MPTEIWGREFREQNLVSKYPFNDSAGLISDSGLMFGSDVLVDAVLHPIGAFASLSLTAIESAAAGVVIWIGNEDEPRLASCALDPRAVPTGGMLIDAYKRQAGYFAFNPDSTRSLQTWPFGVHAFREGDAEFVASCIVPTPEACVRGFVDAAGTLLTDDVWIIGDGGVQASYEGPYTTRLNAVGDPLFRRRSCLDSGSFTAPTYLKTINGVGPDARGGFLLAPAGVTRGRTILRIDPRGTDTLVVSLAGPIP